MFADGFHPKVSGGNWLRAPVIQQWTKCSGVRWSNECTERKAWEVLSELEKCHYRVEEMDQGAATLVADLAEVFEKVQLKLVCAWAMRTRSRKRFHGVLCGYFSTSEG